MFGWRAKDLSASEPSAADLFFARMTPEERTAYHSNNRTSREERGYKRVYVSLKPEQAKMLEALCERYEIQGPAVFRALLNAAYREIIDPRAE